MHWLRYVSLKFYVEQKMWVSLVLVAYLGEETQFFFGNNTEKTAKFSINFDLSDFL